MLKTAHALRRGHAYRCDGAIKCHVTAHLCALAIFRPIAIVDMTFTVCRPWAVISISYALWCLGQQTLSHTTAPHRTRFAGGSEPVGRELVRGTAIADDSGRAVAGVAAAVGDWDPTWAAHWQGVYNSPLSEQI